MRLAERQGLLVGRHISEVASAALNYLIYLDSIERVRDRAERYRFALATRAEYDIEKLFPEYNRDRVVDDESEVPEGEEAAYDYESVEWQSPSDTDQATLNKMLSLLQNASGAVNGNQLMTMNDSEAGWV